ncbi:MAG: phosphodiester glycosidase family protein [Clostridiales bacterium]|nr:phosphodiester glycosidase family protein [Clostridiales bacterium]
MLEDFLNAFKPADEADWNGYAALNEENGLTKLAFYSLCPYFDVKLYHKDYVFADEFNDREPYDRFTHLFRLPTTQLQQGDRLVVSGFKTADGGERFFYKTEFSSESLKNAAELKERYDNHLTVENEEVETISDGLEYRHMLCRDPQNNPVHAFLLRVDMQKNTICVGTPNDDYKVGNIIAKVPEMIDSAVKNGKNVLAAVNADFFDMFGDGSPSGLCVKNGIVIKNSESIRPFIGVKKDGTPVITTLSENPGLLGELEHAAAGLEMILKDGELYEWGPLEPFSFVRHPRTAAGLTSDGTVLLLQIDGRIPEYSNGASLVDLALLLRRFGAVRAVNLDGGGSSVTYTKSGDGFALRSNPADLERPRDKLIRDEYNCLLVVKKD